VERPVLLEAGTSTSMSSTEVASTASTASTSFLGIRLTFTQGFLAGQLSVVLLALVAIRYIIFEDSRTNTSRTSRAKTSAAQADTLRKGRKSTSKKDRSGSDGINIANTMADIMSKVKYEIDSHAGESIDWLNVIVAQALAGYREDISVGGWSGEKKRDQVQKTAREWMEDILNARTVGRGTSFLDPIQVTHVDFGDAYPVFTNARVRPADDTGRMVSGIFSLLSCGHRLNICLYSESKSTLTIRTALPSPSIPSSY
jgi:maintenance of morphology protein 1